MSDCLPRKSDSDFAREALAKLGYELPPHIVAAFSRTRLPRLPKQLPPDQPAPDLTRPGPDLIELGVTQEAARWVVVDIAIAA
jgi:hypothetical protein